jgi:hypothetical protein
MKDKVDSYVSMGTFAVEATSSAEDDNRVDKDPPKWEHVVAEIPVGDPKEGKSQIPKFDHDDGLWTTDMKRKKREVSQQVRGRCQGSASASNKLASSFISNHAPHLCPPSDCHRDSHWNIPLAYHAPNMWRNRGRADVRLRKVPTVHVKILKKRSREI